MSFYDVDYSKHVNWLLAPHKRKPKRLAWLNALISPLQWIHDVFYGIFYNGIDAPLWQELTNYTVGDRIIMTDNFTVWECVEDNYDVSPFEYNPPQTSWIKIADDWIGVKEKAKYNSQRMVLEYLLNRRFSVQYGTVYRDGIFNPTTWVRSNANSDIFISDLDTKRKFFRINTSTGTGVGTIANPARPGLYTEITPFSTQRFAINVPITSPSGLNMATGVTEAGIRAIADPYVIAGITYQVIFYS